MVLGVFWGIKEKDKMDWIMLLWWMELLKVFWLFFLGIWCLDGYCFKYIMWFF